MKIVNLVLAVMFLLFAFVQINDPDPVVWILIYGAMAVTCVLAAFHHYSKAFKIAMAILMVAYLAYSLVYIPGFMEWLAQPDRSVLFDDIAKMQHLYIEEAREFLGLMICVVVLIVQLVRIRKPQIA
jgi:transmembrane protein TMEM220